MDISLSIAHAAVVLLVVVGLAALGRRLAAFVRQPPVVGEIVVGLAAGPVLVALVGRDVFAVLLPVDVRDVLKVVAEAALVLYLVGFTRELRIGPAAPDRRSAVLVSFGALVPPLLCGVGYALWLGTDEALRGRAPAPAFVVCVAVTLAITAVPVLARLLTERRLLDTPEGGLSMTAAVVVDCVGWLLLSLAVALSRGERGFFLVAMAVFGGGLVASVVIRLVLRGGVATRLCGRWPRVAALALGVLALVVGFGVHGLGLTAVFGAVLVGLAVPGGRDWDVPVRTVTRVGGPLLPVFFTSAGLTALTGTLGSLPVPATLLALGLAFVGKIGGGYLGTRMAGRDHRLSVRVGILLDTRGLTELVVLQVGHQAGILTPPVFLALLVMAVVTTALTGPLLSLVDRVPFRVGGISGKRDGLPG
ncbi:cation:proton antiporter [Saccharothrix violaceirubra]|uniref:Kef-type K+ transport system membrane component KefB n=1 Tax=Saccharothrix violaceirubra TaxID=413306 RepID=A0A7W7T1Z8_9PSEU|nr:cation:proton antiporter [Saccharothrix violaceirubra]MBB4965093.1 Kef-type K+ transport system membrane component KefB [Saccharothrix violaceirubra]